MNEYKFDVSVVTQYIAEQSDSMSDSYVFSYTITIKNVGDIPAQLISRHWVIVDANGHTEEVAISSIASNSSVNVRRFAFIFFAISGSKNGAVL